ncbi:hypothetical protein FOZ76_01055 [Verticiella sediminum]|uniref:Uncharacterized protein n=1 Tax=Verticiella sediminum TaxID=1247510 RepID=A0A556B1C2_9BURK|nr:hypothetical protein FOZ76_01055 [Verticiella sediminum]
MWIGSRQSCVPASDAADWSHPHSGPVPWSSTSKHSTTQCSSKRWLGGSR